jgi:hypothetical protein
MYIWFEGILGTTCDFGVRGVAGEDSEFRDGVRLGVCICDAILLTPSGTAVRTGGNSGEIDMLLIDAEWA